jgi:magnesium-transporting ATPase (P-type)
MGRLKRMVASLGQRRAFRKMRSAARHAYSRVANSGFQKRSVDPAQGGDAGFNPGFNPGLWDAEIAGVFSRLHSDPLQGLNGQEVEAARRRYGANVLSLNRGEHWARRFLSQFKSPLMLLLLLTSAVSFIFSGWIDGVVIFAVVFLNGVVGFIQEHRAGKAIDALGAMVQTHATVTRDGKRSRLPAEMLYHLYLL